MTMIVLQPQAARGAAEHPGPGAILTDMKGDADDVLRTFADMHYEALAGKGRVGLAWWAGYAAFVRLSAQC
jgi:hypothetical protein